MNNNNNLNGNTQSSAGSSRLETSEFGTNLTINSNQVHGLQQHQQAQYTPLVQLLDIPTTSITIDENTTEHNLNNLNSETQSNRENIMEQYARYLRQQVVEVTRGGLSNIIAVSGNQQTTNYTTTSTDNSRRLRYLPSVPLRGNILNRVLLPENHIALASQHSNESNGSSNQVMVPLMEHVSDNSASITMPAGMCTARTAASSVASENQTHNLASYFDGSRTPSTAANILQQTVTSRLRLLEEGGIQRSLVERASSMADDRVTSSDITNATRNSNTEMNAPTTNDLYNNVPDIFISTLRQCLHYIPFACILLLKFIYDHFSGLLDIILLQFVMYYVNKSLQAQVAKIDEKKNSILMRDLATVMATITLRLLIATTPPDPFGLLIPPAVEERNIAHQITFNFPQDYSNNPGTTLNKFSSTAQTTMERSATTPATTTIFIPKVISLVALLYYIAVNDLILKLITISIKLIITLIPLRSIRHKSRTRLYVFVEFFSQFYRSLVPIRQWLLFLFESYSGLHAISGVMFSSAYIVLKGCELADRGKTLKKSFFNLLKDVDKSKKPVQNDFDAADELCAICQDSYASPVVLECGHIFCDNCVTTWFKREQTCPMCRAKVGDNLAWHDGSTTFFYQLY
ncbi:uncharacterized protein [Eurosta solidaginis]|uniref:uncharacterized protein n=1 Tax=Eurosta solidaginis TaxID=178769 RepID=UPI003530DF3E